MTLGGYITNIQRCSTEDGPGIRTTLFLKGCPLHCIWCHNIETIDNTPQVVWNATKCIGDRACIEACTQKALELTDEGMLIDHRACNLCGNCEEVCPTGAIEVMGKLRNVEDLVDELARDAPFFETSEGGVTISGGEPLLQHDFTVAIASGLKQRGIHVALDTTGYASEAVWKETVSITDLVLLDIKLMDESRHRQYTGVGLETILRNAKMLADLDIPTWIRTPVIPGHTDNVENIRAIAGFVAKNMPNVLRYDLLAFNKMCQDKYKLFGLEYPLKDLPLMKKQTMLRLVQTAEREGIKQVTWSGMTAREASDIQEVKTERRTAHCG